MGLFDDLYGPNSKRPDHPDFERLIQVIQGFDIAMDSARDDDAKEAAWRALVASYVDTESVTYAALQRVFRALRPPRNKAEAMQQATITALWIDGFFAGAGFQAEGGHREPSS